MKKLLTLLFLISAAVSTFVFQGCGDPEVSLNAVYQPKIAVQAFVYPGEKVKDIRIYRNFPLNTVTDSAKITVKNATVTLNGIPLVYSEATAAYGNNSILIEQGKQYTLEVSAVIDGQALTTRGTTTVPTGRFVLPVKNYGVVPYGEQGVPIKLIPGVITDFYAFSILPKVANLDNFIYNNLYNSRITRQKLMEEGLGNFIFQFKFLKDMLPSTTDTLVVPIKGFDTWFYSDYRVIVYAGDTNFKNFVLTAGSVKELDGNFHTPLMNLDGDGIGVFGSAIRDTAYFTIRNTP